MFRHIILCVLCLSAVVSAWGQKTDRDYIRKGNHLFKDSAFVAAEINYRKALDVNPGSVISMYNLGNTMSQQQKFEEAMKQYNNAAKIEKNKSKLAKIHHNQGVLFQAARDYEKAIEAYKMSLRKNPDDDETRYNLALAQKLLKDSPQDQKKQNQDQQQNEQDQKDQDQKDQQQNKQDQQDQNPPEQKDNEMSKENAEQMLNSVMQDEKDVQEKVKKQQVIQGRRLEKDW